MKAICAYRLPEVSSLQTGPLIVDGTMYFTTDEGSYAIDASTCAEKCLPLMVGPINFKPSFAARVLEILTAPHTRP